MEELVGPLSLTEEQISQVDGCAGVYVTYDRQGFVSGLGRSDCNLRESLNEQAAAGEACSFAYKPAPSPKEAFNLECLLYHAAGGAFAQLIHPVPTPGHTWRCPICWIYG